MEKKTILALPIFQSATARCHRERGLPFSENKESLLRELGDTLPEHLYRSRP
jgi:hypothetical protein